MELIDQTRCEILEDRSHAPTHTNVATSSGFPRPLERSANPFSHVSTKTGTSKGPAMAQTCCGP